MSRLRIFVLSCLCCFVGVNANAQSLVHLWAFENNFDDTSGSNNHGIASGAPTFTAGKFGQGVTIASPSDGVHLDFGAVNLPLLGADSWSMNVWVKLDVALGGLEYVAGFGLNDGWVDNEFHSDVGRTRAILAFSGMTGNDFYFWGGARDVPTGVGYTADGQWHMYTTTYNGTSIQMYKNAVPIFASPVNVVLVDAFDEVHAGNPSNWNSNFDGSLDEFSIFNGALNESQIGGLFVNNDINQPIVLDPSFNVNRDTGEIVLTNDSSFAIDILGYTIRSTSGSLRPSEWSTIAGRFDVNPPGDGSVDSNDAWTVLTNQALQYSTEMSEGVPGTDGGTIAIGKVINFGPSWVANPTEDLAIDLLLDDGLGTIKTVLAQFSGNGGEAYGIGDLDTDGDVDPDDWALFRTSTTRNLSGKTFAEAYLSGDFDGDFDKDINDFSLFVAAFDADNGAGAFSQMLAVPEPSAIALLGLWGCLWVATKFRKYKLLSLCALLAGVTTAMPSSAALWGYYKLNGDANEATGNNINLNLVGDASFGGSVHPGLGFAGLFDGAGDGMIGSNFNKFTTNDVSIVAWAYADSLAADWNTIIKNWGTTAGGQFHFGLGSAAANTLQNFIANGTNVTTATLFPEDTWVHTAFVLDSVALEHRLYMNGEIVATGAYSGTLGTGNALITGLGIGHKPNDDGSDLSNNGPGPWNGRIDDVGLYDEALTTAQIQEIYQNGLAGIQLDGTTSPYIKLLVDRSNGEVILRNTTTGPVSINAYEIFSPEGALIPANWLDLAGNSGFPTGNGTGNGWEKDLASDEHQLLENYLTNNSNFANGLEISLGQIFAGGAENLVFRYRTASGAIVDSIVDYIGAAPDLAGDYNADGIVNAADYALWRDKLGSGTALPNDSGLGTPVGSGHYTLWKSNFGNPGGGGTVVSSVPEPTACWLCASAALSVLGLIQFRRRDSK